MTPSRILQTGLCAAVVLTACGSNVNPSTSAAPSCAVSQRYLEVDNRTGISLDVYQGRTYLGTVGAGATRLALAPTAGAAPGSFVALDSRKAPPTFVSTEGGRLTFRVGCY